MLEQKRRTVNQETIGPEVSMAAMDDIMPILTMVAEVRAAYLKALFELANNRDGMPSAKEIDNLRHLRRSYSELVDATNALETALERGYIDVA
jgi:hypothetical protein